MKKQKKSLARHSYPIYILRGCDTLTEWSIEFSLVSFISTILNLKKLIWGKLQYMLRKVSALFFDGLIEKKFKYSKIDKSTVLKLACYLSTYKIFIDFSIIELFYLFQE